MSTTTIVIIVVAVIVVIAVGLVLARMARERRLDDRRDQAGELRETARVHDSRAERERAAADQQAARAKQAEAEAEEKAAIARRETLAARQRTEAADHETGLAANHHREAQVTDPDAEDPQDDARSTGGRDRGEARR